MLTQTILDNEFATIWYHEESGIIHHRFKKFMNGDNLRQFLETGYNTFEKNRATQWLSDDRLNPVITPEDQKWVNEVWFPKTMKAGWKYWAIVMPEKQVAQMNMRQFAADLSKLGLAVEFFPDPDQAMEWLSKHN
jgi:hypothetical protein